MTQINKENDPSEITNYRPITFLSTVGKLLEHIVLYVFNFLLGHDEVLRLLFSQALWLVIVL